jgi:hypothetical protein
MKRAIAILLVLALTLHAVPVLAEKTANVTVDGVTVLFDQTPVVLDGRTLVPIRAVAEQIGAEVRWNEATRTATVIYKNTGVALQIGNINMVVRNMSTNEEQIVKMDVSPQTYSNRTLLPIRAVVEAFGCKVDWNAASSTVIITTSEYKEPQKTNTIVIGE